MFVCFNVFFTVKKRFSEKGIPFQRYSMNFVLSATLHSPLSNLPIPRGKQIPRFPVLTGRTKTTPTVWTTQTTLRTWSVSTTILLQKQHKNFTIKVNYLSPAHLEMLPPEHTSRPAGLLGVRAEGGGILRGGVGHRHTLRHAGNPPPSIQGRAATRDFGFTPF